MADSYSAPHLVRRHVVEPTLALSKLSQPAPRRLSSLQDRLRLLPGLALSAVLAAVAIRLGATSWLQAHGMTGLTVAIVHVAEGGLARLHRLLDSRFTGLPAQLAPRPGPDTGLITVHKRSAGVVHRMRRAAMSTVVGSIETSFGQEDMQTFSWEAALNTADTLADAADVLAGELLVATQAISLGETGLGPALHNAQDAVRAVVPPIERDRIFGPDLEAIRELLENGDL